MNSIQTKFPGKIKSRASMRVANIFGAIFCALAGVLVLFAFLTSPARAWESQSSIPQEVLFSFGDSNWVANPDLVDTSQATREKTPALATGIIELDTVASWFASDGCNANRLTWGDLEADGDLDLAVQCNMGTENVIRIYLNTGQALETSATWESDPGCVSPAWGDLDGDGDLDLAARCPEARVYLNQSGSLQALATWNPTSIGSGPIAWGDMDGNGFLDLAVGQAVYLNSGGSLSDAPSWTSPYTSSTTISISWGDMDQDRDLDFAASTADGYTRVYRNTNGSLETSPVWQKYLWPKCIQIAWGDMSGDGYPELACSGTNLMAEHTYVYSNTAGALTNSYWRSSENHMGYAVDWGDVDGDGDLDLAVGNSGDNPERVYLNIGTELLTTTVWETSYYVAVNSLAWGDVDGDGDLDLAVAADPPRLHLNRSKSLLPVASQSFSSAPYDRFYSAWGDIDNDGDLDLAMGVSQRTYQGGWGGSSNLKLYVNQAGVLQTPPAQNISLAMDISDVAWGDLDGDGYLDLAVGIAGKPNLVYRNNIGSLDTTPAWTAAITLTTTSMAWGDVDGDGDLDLAVGSNGGNRLHLNQAGTLEDTAAWSSADSLNTQCVSWGDIDGDGDLDLAAANKGDANVVYLNINGSLQPSPGWTSTEKDASHAVAWGDVDGDGDLDLAVGNHDQPIKLYLNQGGSLQTTASWMGWHADAVYGLAWGDVDGDGDLDLVSAGAGGWNGNLASPDRVYLNQGGNLQNTEESIWNSIEMLNSTSVALGDFDNDGDLDIASGPRIYRNQRSGPFLYPQETKSLALGLYSDPVPTFNQPAAALATADFYALPGIRDSGMIPISYTLFNPNGLQVGKIRSFYSKDGGDNWQEAIAAPGTQTTLLGAGVYPTPTVTSTHVFTWDVFNSGLFGRSDDVVVRLEASPVSCCDEPSGTHLYYNQTAGPYQRPFLATVQTFPFRARGTQVKVLYNDTPTENAMVYHIPVGQTHGDAISDNAGHPYKTDVLGYLQGRGELEPGDNLIALFPAKVTDKYTLYYTNASPTETGLQAYTVPDPVGGAQTLVVSDTHPLMLFNLDIALEWDARDDGDFLDDLSDAIQNASAVLYDVSDGQIALGEVRLFMDRQNWTSADIVMYAQSGVRPRASMGGVVEELTDDQYWNGETITNAYGPGQIRIGPNWDPFGTSVAELTPDWQRALAHELSHYLLFLPDNYLGVEPPDNTPITTDCRGSFMTNTYDDEYSEFLTAAGWTGDCTKTIAEHTTGRYDWETVHHFYTALHIPDSDNSGPLSLPLQITHISLIEPGSSPRTLPPRYFDVRDAESGALLAVPRGQGYLFKSQGTSDPADDRLIALGSTTGGGDRIKVRGAEEGDRLCIIGPYDPASNQAYSGCRENLGLLDASVYVEPVSDWDPNIAARAVTSVTLQVTVSLSVPTDTLHLQYFPAYGEPGTDLTYAPTATLTATSAPGVYSTTLELASPSFEGWLRVWIPEAEPPREALSQLYLSPPWGPNSGSIGASADRRAWGANARQLGAPVASGDGQVTIFNLEDIFADTGTVSLQAIHNPPGLYPWLSLVGEAYRFKAEALFPRAIAFEYLQRETPPGYEHTLRIYFSPDEGTSWLRLDTDLDLDFNRATAVMPDNPNQGQGIYALVASLEIPLQTPGWNLFAYPLPGSSPVEAALASLSGYYSTVYGYNSKDTKDPWRVYDIDAPEWVNDLTDLEFGHGYWISATQAMTLYLNVESDFAPAAPSFLPYPPSTLYGQVLPGEDFTPSPGITVTAWIAGQRCGQGLTKEENGQIVYVVDVNADGPSYPGCGIYGKTIVFTVDGHLMAPFPPWNNSRPREMDLAPPPYRLFLPLAIKPSEPFPWP